jgi:tetratricopeptide (TPR) repeat protein
MMMFRGRYTEADEYYRKAIEMNPFNFECLQSYLNFLKEQPQFVPNARQLVKEIEQRTDFSAIAHKNSKWKNISIILDKIERGELDPKGKHSKHSSRSVKRSNDSISDEGGTLRTSESSSSLASESSDDVDVQLDELEK